MSRRTFSTVDDLDLHEVVARKRDSGLTISLVLPTQNEARTVGGVIGMGSALMDTLVDEIVVIDGASTDGTIDIATDAGVTVVQDSHVLPQYGRALGKGDALWRSLAATSGDIVAFIDTDIRNPDPRFVWGIVAPLVLHEGIGFVKGFYDRPIEVGGVLQPSGGGRVTELMARPLINLFWPELAGLAQPLSGEYAGRRDLLERVPFFAGYGVEIGLLIDILADSGAEAIAQVDVGQRVHRNQDLHSLSRMAFAIAHVALQRLSDQHRVHFNDQLSMHYHQFDRDADGSVTLRSDEVADIERPPLRDIR